MAIFLIPVARISAQTNWALTFNGASDYVIVPHRPELNTFPLTIAAWVKLPPTNASGTIVAKASSTSTTGNYRLFVSDGEVRALYAKDRFATVSVGSGGKFAGDGEWHHVAFTVDTNGGRLYVDGALRDNRPLQRPAGALTATDNVFLSRLSNDPNPFPGMMDEVAIWRVARSTEEIQADMLQALSGNEAGLLAYWRMNDPAASVVDATTNHLDGIRTNGAARVLSGMPAPGGAVAFDGIDDYLRVTNFGLAAPTNEITVEFWTRVATSQNQLLFGLSSATATNSLAASVPGGDGQVRWDFGDATGNGRLAYTPTNSIIGGWQHFALVASQSGNWMKIYRNGQLEAQKTGASVLIGGNQDLLIGGLSGLFTAGQLDEFRIWNVARDQTEILSNLNRHLVGSEPGLVLYFRFDERSGNLTFDSSGHGITASLSNHTAWVVSPVEFAPDAVTLPASAIDDTHATLNCTVAANGLPTIAALEWGISTNYDHSVPIDPGLAGSPVALNLALSNLTSGLVHHYRVVASNSAGFSAGIDQWFIPALPPTVRTLEATDVAASNAYTHATMNGTVNPNWSPTLAWFEWGTSVVYEHATPPVDVGNGSGVASLDFPLDGLPANGFYHYRLMASNTAGVKFGQDQTFSAPGIAINGPGIITNEWHAPFADPGAKVREPIITISAGYYHGLALTYDGKVLSWGLVGTTNGIFPNFGQANVPVGVSNIVAISAGSVHSLALRRDGTVVGWGGTDTYHAAVVPPGLNNVAAIAGSSSYSLALLRDGTLTGWGGFPVGGVDFAPDLTDLTALCATEGSSAGITRDGTVIAWGFDAPWPPDYITNVVAISGGFSALQRDGKVIGWGSRGAPSGLTGIKALGAGGIANHTVAIWQDGTATGWGGFISPPPATWTDMLAVSAGGNSTLGLQSGGTVLGWGNNDYGQVSPPTNLVQQARPVTVTSSLNVNVPGTYVVTYSATNGAGVVAVATRTVVVKPPVPPTLSFKKAGNLLHGDFTTAPNEAYFIEASTNLVNWVTLQSGTNGLSGSGSFDDPTNGPFKTRFFRLRVVR